MKNRICSEGEPHGGRIVYLLRKKKEQYINSNSLGNYTREIAFHIMWALQKECSDMLISYQQKGASKFRCIRCKKK